MNKRLITGICCFFLFTAVMAVMAMVPTAIRLGATECILGGWEEESCRVATEWEYLAPTF